jgi:hypothetical protein
MNGVYEAEDEEILADLRRIAAHVDPVPLEVLETARAALSLHRLDIALIELVRDSASDGVGLVAVRGDSDVRMVSFEFPPISVELQVTERDGLRELVAHVSGMDLATARVETETGGRDVDVDDGTIVVEQVPAGLVRLYLTSREGYSYVTSWVRI